MGGIDRHPAAIVQVAGVDDIRRVIAVARETGAELAVRSGGHSGAGYGTTEGGLVIDLRTMKKIDVDPASKTLWAETGLTAAEVSQAAGEHGLAIGFGDTGTVGIGGITTGGGIGYLVRKHGLAIDNVLAADIVTADGELLRADAQTNPDLFWAIRGGGGNFGVVTRFQFQLADLPQVVGGMLFLPVNARDHRALRPARGRGAGGDVDDRERHALPADADGRRGLARQARDLRADVLRGRRGGGRGGLPAVPGAREARRSRCADRRPRRSR